MDTKTAQGTYFATAAIVVFAVGVAVWWYTSVSAPMVPNTGTATSTLDYAPVD